MPRPLESLTPKARRTRRQLVCAAQAIVGRDGPAALSVMRACDAAQVGRTSFYTYFDDADALLATVAEEAAHEVKARFDTLHDGMPRGFDRLRACIAMILRLGAEDPGLASLLTALAAGGGPIRAMLEAEIAAELRGAGAWSPARMVFLPAALVTMTRDIALGRAPGRDIPAYTDMLMAACSDAPPRP